MPIALASLPLQQLVAQLLLDIGASWVRMLVALFLSFIISLFVGIWAARSERAGKVILPIIDIFQTLPILAFFPFVIYVVVIALPPMLGINAAVVFLIVTSMLWNMIFAVYEAIRTLPNEISEVSELYRLSLLQRLRKIYIPAAMPRLVEQSALSWAIGLFYLVTSEIFSTGSSVYTVTHGIGVALTQLAVSGSLAYYAVGLAVFILFVILTRFLLFAPLENYYARRRAAAGMRPAHRQHGIHLRPVAIFGEMQHLYRESLGIRPKRHLKKHLVGPPPQPVPHKETVWWHKYYYTLLFLIAVVALLFITGNINQTTLSYESLVLSALVASFARVWLAFVVILVVSVPLCVYIIFMSKRLSRYITIIQVVASIPATIVLPLIAYAFAGNPMQGEIVAFVIFFLSGIWYVMFGALANSRDLPDNLLEIKKVFHVNRLAAWKKIYTMAIIPGLVTGAVTGIAAEWNASIVAEYFTNAGISGSTVISSVHTGIGRLLDISLSSAPGATINGIVVSQPLLLMAIALINLTVMIVLINTFVWKRLYRKVADIYK